LAKQIIEQEWRSVFRPVIARGLAEIDLDGYGSWRLSDSCGRCCVARKQLALRKGYQPALRPLPSRSEKGRRGRAGQALMGRLLRALRQTTGPVARVPPYVIFPDSTLSDMLRQRPSQSGRIGTGQRMARTSWSDYGCQLSCR